MTRCCPQVVDALRLSRATLAKIRQNLVWAFGYNLICIPLAAGALLPSYNIALTPSIAGPLSRTPCSFGWRQPSLVRALCHEACLPPMLLMPSRRRTDGCQLAGCHEQQPAAAAHRVCRGAAEVDHRRTGSERHARCSLTSEESSNSLTPLMQFTAGSLLAKKS